MKHIQAIDGADNCSFSIYSASEEDFSLIFPEPGQDVEFVEDLVRRIGARAVGELVIRVTSKRVEKPAVNGIHGTLFFGLRERRIFYPNKRESDFDAPELAEALRRRVLPRRKRSSQEKQRTGKPETGNRGSLSRPTADRLDAENPGKHCDKGGVE